MSRLIAFEHRVGSWLAIDGRNFEILQHLRGSGFMTLKPRNGDPLVTLSTSELAALLVQERAAYIDEFEAPDPEPKPLRVFTHLSNLDIARTFDWFSKMYLIRRMYPFIGHSPKSDAFRNGFAESCENLENYLKETIQGCKTWSIWTAYHDLLRFKNYRFDIAALQKKGVEYCGYKARFPHYAIATSLANSIYLEEPHLTAAAVRKKVLALMKKSSQSKENLHATEN